MNYDTLADKKTMEETIAALNERGYKAEMVETGAEALEKIKTMIPAGVSVAAGSSTTLNEIGFTDYLKDGEHGWNNLKAGILAETDPAKQAILRKQATLSDWYLGSAHAISKDGQIVVASASGSQLPHLAYTSPNLILVVSVKKITNDLNEALERVREHVVPLEDKRMKSTGAAGTVLSKILILERETSFMGRNFHVIFVNEKLGF